MSQVTTWGDKREPTKRGRLQQLTSSGRSFAALQDDDFLVTWGDSLGPGPSDVKLRQLRALGQGFAALLSDGSQVTWGHPLLEGLDGLDGSQVQDVQATQDGHAAILADGSLVVWSDREEVREQLRGTEIRLLALKSEGI